jgi:hypothetical protein
MIKYRDTYCIRRDGCPWLAAEAAPKGYACAYPRSLPAQAAEGVSAREAGISRGIHAATLALPPGSGFMRKVHHAANWW